MKRTFPRMIGFSAILMMIAGLGFSFASPLQPQKLDQLIVFGQGFMFGVREPDGWFGDTERAARFKVNILFYPKGHRGKALEGMIRVGIFKKQDENTLVDLQTDMDGYKKRYSEVIFEDIDASHGLYTSFPKLFIVEGRIHEYVAYVNPGKSFWFLFSVALSTGKRRASDDELKAFREITASLLAMGGSARREARPSDFDTALKAAKANLGQKKGRKYDAAFARRAGPWLARALAACSRELPEQDLAPFIVLVRVSASGRPEEVLVRPATKVALCLRPSFASATFPKPPGPSWWVKMEIVIK
jgi:hypothetical protein